MYSFAFKTQYILRLKAKIIFFFLNLVSAGFCTTPSNYLTFLIVEKMRKSLALKQKILLIISSIHRLDYQYSSTCNRIDGCLVYSKSGWSRLLYSVIHIPHHWTIDNFCLFFLVDVWWVIRSLGGGIHILVCHLNLKFCRNFVKKKPTDWDLKTKKIFNNDLISSLFLCFF